MEVAQATVGQKITAAWDTAEQRIIALQKKTAKKMQNITIQQQIEIHHGETHPTKQTAQVKGCDM